MNMGGMLLPKQQNAYCLVDWVQCTYRNAHSALFLSITGFCERIVASNEPPIFQTFFFSSVIVNYFISAAEYFTKAAAGCPVARIFGIRRWNFVVQETEIV